MIKYTVLVFAVILFLVSNALASADTLLIRPDSMIGNNIGHFIDTRDKDRILQSLQSVNFNKPSSWKSASSGIAYTVKPGSLNKSEQKACRQFTLHFAFRSLRNTFPGTACQEKDGNWVVVK